MPCMLEDKQRTLCQTFFMNLKYINKKFIFYLFILSSIFSLDRVSKLYVISLNEKNFGTELFVSTFLNITLIWNKGIAFGLFDFSQDYLYNLLSLFIAIVILIIFIIALKSEGFKKYALFMIFSGATGNLYDRIFYKSVPDFIDLHIDEFHWFIFNVADIFITLGVIFMILFELIVIKESKHEKN